MGNIAQLSIDFEGQQMPVGKLTWGTGPSGYSYEVPQQQEVNGFSLTLVGLQYIDFSDYLLLIEAMDVEGQVFGHFYFDTSEHNPKHKENIFLKEQKDAYIGFNLRVKDRLDRAF